jgi:hypothetical protein
VAEVVCAFAWRYGGEEEADGLPELVLGVCRDRVQGCFELGEQLLDLVEIGE